MDEARELFFRMVDQTTVHPLVSWARDEIIRLEMLLQAGGTPPQPEPPAPSGGETVLPDGQ